MAPSGSTQNGLLRSVGEKLLTAALTGGALVGFLAVAGGAIAWTKLRSAQLPAEQAIYALPQRELVAAGAASLTLFAVLGLLALGLVYLIDSKGRPVRTMSYGLLALITVESAVVIVLAEKGLDDSLFAAELLVLAVALTLALTRSSRFSSSEDGTPATPPDDRRRAQRRLKGKRRWAGIVIVLALVLGLVWVGLVQADASWRTFALGLVLATAALAAVVYWIAADPAPEERAVAERASARGWPGSLWAPPVPPPADEGPGDEPRFRLTRLGRALSVVPVAVLVAGVWAALGEWWAGVALAVVVLLAISNWTIARLSGDRFLRYGVAVFASVPLFGAVVAVARNADDPQVQAMALITKGDQRRVVQGLYVTETDRRVYFASVATDGCGERLRLDSGRLTWISTDNVAAMAIAPAQSVSTASRSAYAMFDALALEAANGAPADASAKDGAASMTTADGANPAPTTAASVVVDEPAVRRGFGPGQELALTTQRQLEPADGKQRNVTTQTPASDVGTSVEGRRSLVATPGAIVALRGRGFRRPTEDGSYRASDLPPTVRVGGTGAEVLDWDSHTVLFRVPDGAATGRVRVQCSPPAGAPLLRVASRPTARIDIRLRPGSQSVVLDSSGSTPKGVASRRWSIDRPNGKPDTVSAPRVVLRLVPREEPYSITLKVTDATGAEDSATVRILRINPLSFRFGRDALVGRQGLLSKEEVRALRKRLRDTMKDAARVELHGHADEIDTPAFNDQLSLRRARRARRELIPKPPLTPPVRLLAFGERCRLDRRPGPRPRNRRVDVFVLGPHTRVVLPRGCRPRFSE